MKNKEKRTRKGMVNFNDLLCKKEVVSLNIDITSADQIDECTIKVIIRLQNERFLHSQKRISPDEKPIIHE